MSHSFIAHPPSPPATDLTHWWHYTHSSVRDLAWLLCSPALFDARLGKHATLDLAFDTANAQRWLQGLDAQLRLDCGSCTIPRRHTFRRLGLYCEALLAYYFEHAHKHQVSTWRLLARNVQAHHQGHTLGELDYVIEDDMQHVVHVELAVKFYLQVENGSGNWADWVGPNAVDRLDIKLHRMLEHQLTLPQKITAKNAIEEIACVAEISSSRQLIKGVNFIHCSHRNTPNRPDFANNSMLWGRWMHLTEFKHYAYCSHDPIDTAGIGRSAISTTTEAQAVLCDKLEWLTGPESTTTGCSLEDLVPIVEALYTRAKLLQRKPPGLQVMVWHGARDQLGDVERLMIVPDGWPTAVP